MPNQTDFLYTSYANVLFFFIIINSLIIFGMKNQLEKSKIEDLTFIFEPIFAFSFAKNDKTYKIKLQKRKYFLKKMLRS